MENTNEKILAESKLYNIAKFRNVMIIIGVILFIASFSVIFIRDSKEKKEFRESKIKFAEEGYNEGIERYENFKNSCNKIKLMCSEFKFITLSNS